MAAKQSWILGIDIGTTFCAAAGRSADGRAEVIEIGGQRRIPSVIVLDEQGQIVVGQSAENLAAANPSRAVRAPKSRIGDPAPIVIGGRLYESVELVAALLRHLYDGAVAQRGSAPAEVRLTHPAIWGRPRIEQLRAAAERAGVPQPVLVSEPVAAAVAYADEVGLGEPSGDGEATSAAVHVAVYDLGGGTFDTAVLRTTPTGFAVVGRPVGEDRLGGELFDELLANHVGQQLDPAAWEALQISEDLRWQQSAAALRSEARRVKEALSTHPYAELMVSLPDGFVQHRVTRDELENLMRPYIEQSVDRLAQVVADAGLQPSQLAAICLTGGASHAPLVEASIRAAFPQVTIGRRGDPKTAVALGATLATPSGVGASLDAGLAPGSNPPVVAAGPPFGSPSTVAAGPNGPGSAGLAGLAGLAGSPATVGPHLGQPPLDLSGPAPGPPAGPPPWPSAPVAPPQGPITAPLAFHPGAADGPVLGAGSSISGRSPRVPHLAWYAAAIVVVLALIGTVLLIRGGTDAGEVETASRNRDSTTTSGSGRRSSTTTSRAPTTTATTTATTPPGTLAVDSPTEQFLGTEVRRHWALDATRANLTVTVTLTNAAAGAFRWHHDEVVPKAVAADASAVLTNPPAEVLQADPMLRWWYELAPRQSITFTYTVVRQKSWPAATAMDLTSWETARATATVTRQGEIMKANNLTDRSAAPVPVAALTATVSVPGPVAGTAPPTTARPIVVVVTSPPPAGPSAPTVAITGGRALCVGQASFIEGVATGAVSGVWTITSFAIADASWSPSSPGQYLEPTPEAAGGSYRATLSVVNSANVAATAVFDFTVIHCTPQVAIDGPSQMCAGDTRTFTGFAIDAVSGRWDLPEFSVSDAVWTPDSPTQFATPNAAAIGGTFTWTLTVVGATGLSATTQFSFTVFAC